MLLLTVALRNPLSQSLFFIRRLLSPLTQLIAANCSDVTMITLRHEKATVCSQSALRPRRDVTS